jgi:hypothetical protein
MSLSMVYVGNDVVKDKHDCFIIGYGGEVLYEVFEISNNIDRFDDLFRKFRQLLNFLSM